MAYDAARGRTVRFGGAKREGVGRFSWPTDTWAWDSTKWTTIASEGPQGRAASSMVYDSKRRQLVLFGGQGAAPAEGQRQQMFSDTWIWNGKAWLPAGTVGPPARSFHAMTFDSRRGLVVLYGGSHGDTVFEDMWTWDGVRWTEIARGGATPGKRRLHGLAYDAAAGRTVLYGGAGPRPGGGTVTYGDTWEFDGTRWMRKD